MEEVLVDQQLCTQDRNPSLGLDDPEPPQIKEEEEELGTSLEEEQLLTDAYEENDHSGPEANEDQRLLSGKNRKSPDCKTYWNGF